MGGLLLLYKCSSPVLAPPSQILEIISQLYLVKLTREKVLLLRECYRGKL